MPEDFCRVSVLIAKKGTDKGGLVADYIVTSTDHLLHKIFFTENIKEAIE